MKAAATLRPLSGEPAAVERLVGDWLNARSPSPLTVRTSGSGGEPKDVGLSADAVRASASATLARLGGPGQWVLALPAHYVAGLQVVVRSVLAGTSPVVLADHADLTAATRALTHERRYLALVPTQLQRMLTRRREAAALATFDSVLLGGAAATPTLLAEARRLGIAVVTTYGMSETCGGCVYDGLPLDDVSVRLAAGGRVMVSGPVLFDGYVGQPALTAEVLRDGWLCTPDIGRFDDRDRLQILGRVDDVAVSGGVNVPLAAVQARLTEHPEIAAVAVDGVPDPEWGTRVVAVEVPAAGAEPPGLARVRDFVGEVHPREWAPRTVVVSDELPLLESGKVDRQSLLRAVTGGRD
ncbi:MAG: o-succinylbenzoate---CoA ligase [Pseudonocardiales bacterium]|nr:o-succinylbenzoate---CoA ligase [Pseudonocardiales bacterium]